MTRAFANDGRFWVVFDTSSRLAYYRDVHNLLAAPAGSIMRYDYRRKYLTEEVTAALDDKTVSLPDHVLLAYAQHPTYTRGAAAIPNIAAFDNALWVGTRLARMVCVTDAAGEYFFDFQVLGYPAQGPAFLGIIQERFESGETPTSKYISFSANNASFADLTVGIDEERWAAIVETLALPPSQFAGDVFWRVVSFKETGRPGPISFALTPDREGTEIRQMRAHLPVSESKVYSCEIATKRSPANRHGGPPTEYRIQVGSDERELLRVVGSGQIEVRQYTREHLEIECKSLGFLISRWAGVSLQTIPKDGEWVQGAELAVRVRVEKRWGVAVVSLIMLAAAVVLAPVSAWPLFQGTAHGVLPLAGLAGAVILGAVGATLWSGKLATK
jgi:hypothetical protein